MDERDLWLLLDGRINSAESKDLKYLTLTTHEAREIIKLLKELDDLKPCEYDPFKGGQSMSEKQCPYYVDSHSCYWCVFKNAENCPKQKP